MAHAMTAIPAGATRRVALGPSAPVRVAPTVRTLRRRRLMVLLAAVTTAVLLVLAASRAAATFRDVPASVPERRPVPALDAAVAGSAAERDGMPIWRDGGSDIGGVLFRQR